MRLSAFFLSAIILASAFRCSSGEGTTNILINDIWALESIRGEIFKVDSTFKQQPLIEIHLKDERLNGNSGCNNLSGKAIVDGNKISFSEMATTKMFCPGNLEQKFLSALEDVNNYKIEKMRLFLYKDKTEMMVFRKVD